MTKRLSGRPTWRSRRPTSARTSDGGTMRCARSGSSKIAPTLMRGLSEAKGSWKTTCIWGRRRRSCAGAGASTSWPSNRTLPRRRLGQAQEAAAQGGLAAAGLADQAQGLPGVQGQVHAVHGPQGFRDAPQGADAPGNRVVLGEAGDFEQCHRSEVFFLKHGVPGGVRLPDDLRRVGDPQLHMAALLAEMGFQCPGAGRRGAGRGPRRRRLDFARGPR